MSAKIKATFLIICSQKNFDHAPTHYHDITFLMIQSVGKVIQVSNQLSQRGATKNLN